MGSTNIEGALAAGDLVALRHPRAADLEEWCELKRSSAAHLAPTSPISEHGDNMEAEFARVLDGYDSETTQRHLIVRVEDGAIVGMVGLSQIFRRAFCNCFLGYWVGDGHLRRGYGTEGSRLAVDRAFRDLGLHRVEANIMPTNTASIALVRSLGFAFEGYSRKYLQIAGAWEDHTRWAVTAEGWAGGGTPDAG
ncbi:MAG: ribosomal-protein-alanine N-acetyltransferase [Phycisphaeraceae bacterium]|nr:MAG: ribosomal-protein-alanine N-acetyltransferase [Phycisphaeraceae bacterium]